MLLAITVGLFTDYRVASGFTHPICVNQSVQLKKNLYFFMMAVVLLFASAAKACQKGTVSESESPQAESHIEEASADKAPARASSTLPKGLEIPKYESSRGGQLIKHIGYTLSYDADFKTPQWVAWELTAEEAEGTVPRAKKFLPDPDVRGAKAYHSDYTHSGYDRGHMAPAADMKWSEEAMQESFYLSNVCPQNQNLNRGDWKDLEELEREWAARYGAVSIAAGPIYRSARPERIGANKVAVPDAFFKVLLVDYPKQPKAYGFIFENKAGSRKLEYYQRTVDEIEQTTGMDFFSALPDDLETEIESVKPAI